MVEGYDKNNYVIKKRKYRQLVSVQKGFFFLVIIMYIRFFSRVGIGGGLVCIYRFLSRFNIGGIQRQVFRGGECSNIFNIGIGF